MSAYFRERGAQRSQIAESELTNFLRGGGEMAAMILSKNWSQTPLGVIESWPQSLRTAVSLCLASNFPINLIWGPRHTQIYNDGYRVVCGDAHPAALGQGYDVTWASAWPEIGEPFARARRGETSFLENQRMFLTRNGYLEETFFTFSLSPIRDENGDVAGLFHPVTETTQTMLLARRTSALRNLSANLATASDVEELAVKTVATLSEFEYSLPFVLFYQRAPDGGGYRLAAQCGVAPGTRVSPAEIAPGAETPWPIGQAIAKSGLVEADGIRAWLAGIACGPYEEAPDKAIVAPIHFQGQQLPSAIVVFGVSSRRPFDQAYRDFYDLLARSIAAAFAVTRAHEDERRRSEALAEIDRAKTMFFSNISHEFRTPLTLMLGPIEEMLEDARDFTPTQRERLGLTHRNALRLLKLVNTLLDFARLEAGRVQAQFAATDLAALTADLASNFRSACERAGLGFVVDCPKLSRPAYVDREMWEKIVLNLVSNAFKFTLAGRIEISLRETATGIVLTVRDSGVGISAADISRVFERFHRIEGQRGRSHEGSGIGLSLVRELVRLHGGAIDAESIEHRGTTFRVSIPFGVEHLPPDHVETSTGAVAATTRSAAFVQEALAWLPGAERERSEDSRHEAGRIEPAGTPRIVVADDNADMRNYLRQILESGGYEIETVADGAAALVAARRRPRPDLVLCDVMMPELDGFGLLKAIRADPDLEGLLVVMLSARAGEEARLEGLAAGADDYLVKPFSARELRARIDGAVRVGQQRSEIAARERETKIELERRVAERTADLMRLNEQLRQSQKMEAIGLLAGGIAHDFNNLLQVMSLCAALLQEKLDKSEIPLVELTDITDAIARGQAVTRQLLTFSRKQPAEMKSLDLPGVVSGMHSMLRRTLPATIAIHRQDEPQVWRVRADQGHLEQVILNLVINARDAMPAGGKLTLSIANAVLPGDDPQGPRLEFVALRVCDTGVGMEKAVLERVFEPFFTTKDRRKGTGLGLATCYGIVAQAGGRIVAESAPGAGSAFTVLLPRCLDEPASEVKADPVPGSMGGTERILVVEDDEAVLRAATQILARAGYRVTGVENGEDALALLRDEDSAFDLVLSDAVMPLLGGPELALAVLELERRPPVILMSGYSQLERRTERDPIGVRPALLKPFDRKTLLTVVREALDSHAAQGGTSAPESSQVRARPEA
jgi:signal transduction histidine kinase